MSAHVEQPMPVRTDGPSIQGMVRADLALRPQSTAGQVAADLVIREQVGVQRYGTSLQAFNRRDALRDAYEEAVDLAVYLKQAIVEGYGGLGGAYDQAIGLACLLKLAMLNRDGDR